MEGCLALWTADLRGHLESLVAFRMEGLGRTRAGIIEHRFFKPLFEDIYGMEIDYFNTGLLIQLTLTSMDVVFHSSSLRVLKWKLWKNGA